MRTMYFLMQICILNHNFLIYYDCHSEVMIKLAKTWFEAKGPPNNDSYICTHLYMTILMKF